MEEWDEQGPLDQRLNKPLSTGHVDPSTPLLVDKFELVRTPFQPLDLTSCNDLDRCFRIRYMLHSALWISLFLNGNEVSFLSHRLR